MKTFQEKGQCGIIAIQNRNTKKVWQTFTASLPFSSSLKIKLPSSCLRTSATHLMNLLKSDPNSPNSEMRHFESVGVCVRESNLANYGAWVVLWSYWLELDFPCMPFLFHFTPNCYTLFNWANVQCAHFMHIDAILLIHAHIHTGSAWLAHTGPIFFYCILSINSFIITLG